MTKLEFDDEFSRLMEEFNVSAGAVERRARILAALDLKTGMHVLDVGCGPGHQAYEIARVIGSDGRAEGVDSAEGSVETGRRRWWLCDFHILARRADDAGLALVLEPVALALDLDDLGVMQQAVEHGRGQHAVAGHHW